MQKIPIRRAGGIPNEQMKPEPLKNTRGRLNIGSIYITPFAFQINLVFFHKLDPLLSYPCS